MTQNPPSQDSGANGPIVGPPLGFGKGVHEYLAHYINVADAKISMLTGLALAVLGFLLSKNIGSASVNALKWLGVTGEIVAVAAGVFALYPRLTSGGKSPIFWEDVVSRRSPLTYFEDVERLDDRAVEREYALQNYYLSDILHRKYRAIRVGLVSFLVGALMAALVLALV